MTRRYIAEFDAFIGQAVASEDPSGDLVRYLDYEKLVVAIRDTILDLDHTGEHPSYKRRLEKVLVDLGEEI